MKKEIGNKRIGTQLLQKKKEKKKTSEAEALVALPPRVGFAWLGPHLRMGYRPKVHPRGSSTVVGPPHRPLVVAWTAGRARRGRRVLAGAAGARRGRHVLAWWCRRALSSADGQTGSRTMSLLRTALVSVGRLIFGAGEKVKVKNLRKERKT